MQFIGRRDTVLICVIPKHKTIIDFVVTVDKAVHIIIVFGKGFKTRRRILAVMQNGSVSEQLASVVNDSVSVAIQGKERVVTLNPACLLGYTVVVKIEIHTVPHACKLKAVFAYVDNKGIVVFYCGFG